jgi:hypothetical protein
VIGSNKPGLKLLTPLQTRRNDYGARTDSRIEYMGQESSAEVINETGEQISLCFGTQIAYGETYKLNRFLKTEKAVNIASYLLKAKTVKPA